VELSALTAALAVEEMETQWGEGKAPGAKGWKHRLKPVGDYRKPAASGRLESRDSAARIAFRQMATEWARLAFNEEFISPVGEPIDPPSSESSEATPVEILASSLLTPSSENSQPEVDRDWTRPHKRLSLPRSLSSKLWGKSRSH
jgi:hypothetical protein